MNKKIWILIITILTIVLIYSSIVYQGSFEGRVADAVTKEPIKNLDIYYTYHLAKPCISVDTCPGYNVKELRIDTDQEGNYLIPGFFSFKIPFSHNPQISIWFPTSQENQKTQFSEQYWWERLDTAGFRGGYPINIKTSFSKQKADILLIPKLNNSVKQCDLIAEPWSKGKCIEVNSWNLALNLLNVSFCDNLGDSQMYDIYVQGNSGGKVDCINAVNMRLR